MRWRFLGLILSCLGLLVVARSEEPRSNILAEAPGQAAARPANLASVLDAFLAEHASENSAWRSEVHWAGQPTTEAMPLNIQRGYSAIAGVFYFRSRTSETLSPEERRGIFRDPRFLIYLHQLRTQADRGVPARPGIAASSAANAPTVPAELPPLNRADVLAKLQTHALATLHPILFSVSPEDLISPTQTVVVASSARTP